jgi:hypothetical protein
VAGSVGVDGYPEAFIAASQAASVVACA